MELVVLQLPIVKFTNYTLLIEKYTDKFLRCRYFNLRASRPISDLLNAFNITPIVELIENKTRNFMRQCLDIRYIELQFLSICRLKCMVYEHLNLSKRKKTGRICILTSCCT